ncbi:2319_t:CDS:2, partial [Gigaspora margarita]
MLVLDSFSAHITDRAKALFRSGNTDLAVIPGGLTGMYQPLDVSINKPFKDKLRKCWHRWMSNGGNGLTKKGNLKRADLNTVCCWVLNTWEDISEDIIIRSFKKCGISNCLSGKSDKDSEEEDSDENDEDSDENDEDSDEYEDENSDETGDEDSNENEYEDSDENE